MKKTIRLNFCSAFLPLYYLAKIVGMAQYSHTTANKEKTPKCQKKDLIFGCFFVISYIAMGFYTLIMIYKNYGYLEIVPNFAVATAIAYLIFLQILCISFSILFRNTVVKCIKRIDLLDEAFRKVNIKADYKLTEGFVRNKTIYVTISTFLKTILLVKITNMNVIQLLDILTSIFVKSVMKNQFTILTLQIKDRYVKINNEINTFFIKNKEKVPENETSDHINYVMKMLFLLSRLHYKLRKIMHDVITAYSVQLLFYLGGSLCDIIFQSYFLYVIMTVGDLTKTAFFLASTIVWFVDAVYELYTLVSACASVSDTVSNLVCLQIEYAILDKAISKVYV